MFRAFLLILEIILLIIVTTLLAPVALLLNKTNSKQLQPLTQGVVKFFAKLALLCCSTKITFIGKENLPDIPCLYVANHRSYFDIIMTMPMVQKKTFYIAKKGVGKVPILKFWMPKLGCLLLDRKDMKQSLTVIVQAIKQIKNGYSCVIFPEGTRLNHPNHEMNPFKEGSFKPAIKTGCPIVPISIINSRAIFEDNYPWFKKAHCTIVIDKPIYHKDLSDDEKKQTGAYVQNIIRENIKKYL